VHGESDGLVPIGQSEALLAALRAAGVESELVRVPGADHVFLGTDPVPQIERGVAYLVGKLTA
jgi:dipeptidyl aminopeptidase/acylaminoacyl peptidase